MIRKLSHATIYVTDQDRAKAFYTEKLGFTVRADAGVGPLRWLTVSPPAQPDVEIVLTPIATGVFIDDESVRALRTLVENGNIGAGVFEVEDCRKTYEELKARGVEFLSDPMERPYGLEAVFRDDSGNFFSLSQKR